MIRMLFSVVRCITSYKYINIKFWVHQFFLPHFLHLAHLTLMVWLREALWYSLILVWILADVIVNILYFAWCYCYLIIAFVMDLISFFFFKNQEKLKNLRAMWVFLVMKSCQLLVDQVRFVYVGKQEVCLTVSF